MPEMGSLLIVGTGIQAAGQFTAESLNAIRNADRVFYLVTEKVAEGYIQRLNPNTESLSDCYVDGAARLATYQAMVERILSPVMSGLNVCAAFYGHPCVFVLPSRLALRKARAKGAYARILAGISAEDCLYADLGIDPATTGCQSFEATDFLVFRRTPDPSSALIIWQPGVVGDLSYQRSGYQLPGLQILVDYLLQFYPADHEVIIYEAAVYSFYNFKAQRISLGNLEQAHLSPISTLLIPPAETAEVDPKMLASLGLEASEIMEVQNNLIDLVDPDVAADRMEQPITFSS